MGVYGVLASILGTILTLYSCNTDSGNDQKVTSNSPMSPAIASLEGPIVINYALLDSKNFIPVDNIYYPEITSNALLNIGSNLFGVISPPTHKSRYRAYKGISEQLDPIDTSLLTLLQWNYVFTRKVVACNWGVSEFDVGIAIRNLERLGLVILLQKGKRDKDYTYLPFTETNSNIRGPKKFFFYVQMTSLGWDFLRRCANRPMIDKNGEEYLILDWWDESTNINYNNDQF